MWVFLCKINKYSMWYEKWYEFKEKTAEDIDLQRF